MSSPFKPESKILKGNNVSLFPLALKHAEPLMASLGHPNVFRYMNCKAPESVGDMEALITRALEDADKKGDVPFAMYSEEAGTYVGSTRFLDVRPEHRGLEIGWTWVGWDYQRTGISTECKCLMFKYAFDELGAYRVQLKTDSRNEISQSSILKLGAKREGTLRNHMKLWDGYVRHTVMFSVTHKEWKNEVQSALRLRML